MTSKAEVNLSVEYLSFTVKSPILGRNLVWVVWLEPLTQKLDVNKVAVAGSSAVYVKKISKMVASIETGHCLLRRSEKAKQFISWCWWWFLTVIRQIVFWPRTVEFGSYASNHNTTPDGVPDLFLNGTDDTMYKDANLTDIDKNTTGAKNRGCW